jgi:rhodanese-related sulfurtransferase
LNLEKKMNKKLNLSLILLVIVSMVLSACAPAAPAVEEVVAPPTVAPATVVPPTEVPPTPEPAPDFAVLYAQMIGALPQGYAGMKPADVSAAMAEATPPFLLDVREAAELEKDGYIKGAVQMSVREVLKNLDKLPAPDAKIIIYCGSGQRGGMLMGVLRVLGYTSVFNMGGGLGAWKTAKLPVETGSMPEAAKAISTPIIADKALYTALDESMSTLPDGFLGTKADKVKEMMASATPPTLLDLRTADEVTKSGYIEGSINIPVGELFTSLDKLPAKDAPIVLYCGSGLRGSIAIEGLRLLGYTNVLNMGGGFGAWKTAAFPIAGIADWNMVWKDFLTNLPGDYYTIKADLLKGQIDGGAAPFMLDVREAAEIETAGYIKGAVNIPVRNVLKNLDKLPAQDQPIVIYCGSGHRGAMVMASLRMLGYTDVRNLGGGLGGWVKAEFPVEKGTKPADPVAGTAPTVDPILFRDLDAFLSTLPDGFYSLKAADVQAAATSATPPVLIDLRTADEFKSGYIAGSVHIPVNEFMVDMTKLPTDKAAPVILICQSGHRGAMAMMAMRMLGYTNVNSLAKGINGWNADKLPLEK